MRFLLLFLAIWTSVFMAYFLYPFSRYQLVHGLPVPWMIYVVTHLALLFFGLALGLRIRRHKILVICNRRLLFRYYVFLTAMGGLFTLLKVVIVVQSVGLPSSLYHLYALKMAHLQGDVRIPGVIEFFSRYPALAACILAGVFYTCVGTSLPFAAAFLILAINNLAIGSRGDIGLGLVLFVATVITLSYIQRRPTWRVFLSGNLAIIILIALGILVGVFIGRHGYDTLIYAIDDFVLYLAANIPATVIVLEMIHRGDLPSTFPMMTLGFTRLMVMALGDSTNPAITVDFGYVPVFAHMEVGVDAAYNAYTYIAYLASEFGIWGSLPASFLIGFLTTYSVSRALVSRNTFWLVASIMMVSLVLTSPLYLALKLISWWIAWIIALWCMRRSVLLRPTP